MNGAKCEKIQWKTRKMFRIKNEEKHVMLSIVILASMRHLHQDDPFALSYFFHCGNSLALHGCIGSPTLTCEIFHIQMHVFEIILETFFFPNEMNKFE